MGCTQSLRGFYKTALCHKSTQQSNAARNGHQKKPPAADPEDDDARAATTHDVPCRRTPDVTTHGDDTFSQQEKRVLRETWEALGSHHRQHTGVLIFLTIFAQCPEAKAAFPFGDLDGDELMGNILFRSHALRFMNAVDTAVCSLDALDVALVPVLLALGRQHARLGRAALPTQLPVFMRALVAVFQRQLVGAAGGAAVAPDVTAAWTKLAAFIAETMLQGYYQDSSRKWPVEQGGGEGQRVEEGCRGEEDGGGKMVEGFGVVESKMGGCHGDGRGHRNSGDVGLQGEREAGGDGFVGQHEPGPSQAGKECQGEIIQGVFDECLGAVVLETGGESNLMIDEGDSGLELVGSAGGFGEANGKLVKPSSVGFVGDKNRNADRFAANDVLQEISTKDQCCRHEGAISGGDSSSQTTKCLGGSVNTVLGGERALEQHNIDRVEHCCSIDDGAMKREQRNTDDGAINTSNLACSGENERSHTKDQRAVEMPYCSADFGGINSMAISHIGDESLACSDETQGHNVAQNETGSTKAANGASD